MGEVFICRRNVLSISPKVFLYNLGDECVSITGGWIFKFQRIISQYTVLTKNSDHMIINCGKVNGFTNTCGAGTSVPVNLSLFKKLCFECDVYLTVSSKTADYSIPNARGVASSFPLPGDPGLPQTFTNALAQDILYFPQYSSISYTNLLVTIDITNVNSGYVAFDSWYASTAIMVGGTHQKINRIWLE